VNQTLAGLKVEQHPDKTFIGRLERGFTFLGYWIADKGVAGVAPSAWEGFEERVARLYEQDAPLEEIRQRIGQYVRRWMRWVLSGVRESCGQFMWPDPFVAYASWLGIETLRPAPSGR
jgi:RNA-directed DNA polymerase